MNDIDNEVNIEPKSQSSFSTVVDQVIDAARKTICDTHPDNIDDKSKIRVGIIDNDMYARKLLKFSLESSTDSLNHTQVWTTDDPQIAIRQSTLTNPATNILLVDMSMEKMSGIQVIREVRSRNDSIIIIGITSFPPAMYANDAAQAGAQYMLAKSNPSLIKKAIHHALSGVVEQADFANTTFLPPKEAYKRLTIHMDSFHDFTEQQRAVADLCCEGYTSKEIAEQLGIAPTTVNTHMQHIMERLQAKNRVHMAVLWMQHEQNTYYAKNSR